MAAPGRSSIPSIGTHFNEVEISKPQGDHVVSPHSFALGGSSSNHDRTAALSEGPAAASADAKSRRIIPNRLSSTCRCGWCSAHSRGPFPRTFGGGIKMRPHQSLLRSMNMTAYSAFSSAPFVWPLHSEQQKKFNRSKRSERRKSSALCSLRWLLFECDGAKTGRVSGLRGKDPS